MTENVKFTQDSPTGAYVTDDTGVLVAFTRSYTDIPQAIVRDTDGKYILAPLGDIEYVEPEP